jgi:hypothetical protein
MLDNHMPREGRGSAMLDASFTRKEQRAQGER